MPDPPALKYEFIFITSAGPPGTQIWVHFYNQCRTPRHSQCRTPWHSKGGSQNRQNMHRCNVWEFSAGPPGTQIGVSAGSPSSQNGVRFYNQCLSAATPALEWFSTFISLKHRPPYDPQTDFHTYKQMYKLMPHYYVYVQQYYNVF